MTLTYNLFATRAVDVSNSVVDNPLRKSIKNALKDPKFMPDSGTLVFQCKHQYTNDSITLANTDPSLVLKGLDAILYEVAKSLGLKASVKVLYLN